MSPDAPLVGLVRLAARAAGAPSAVLALPEGVVVSGPRGGCTHDGGTAACALRAVPGGGTLCAPGDGEPLDDVVAQLVALRDARREARTEGGQAALYRELVEAGGDVLSRHLPDGTNAYVSPSVAQVLGRDPQELVGIPGLSPLHVDDRPAAQAAVASALRGEHTRVRLRLQHADGSWRHCDVRLSPLYDASGGVAELHSVARDVTEQVVAEQGRQESERRYRQLVEQTPDAILVHVDAVVVFANPAAAQLLGAASPDEVVGRPLGDVVDPDLGPLLARRIARVLDGQAVPLLRQRVRRLDGAWVEVEASGARVQLDGRHGVQNVIRPVAEQEQARQALVQATRALATAQDEREQLRGVLDAAADAYLVSDDSGRLQEWNLAAERLFGLTAEDRAEEAAGGVRRVMSDAQWAAWLPLRARVLAGDPDLVGTTLSLGMQRLDGTPLQVEGSWWPVRGADGGTRLHGLLRDVGPRRQQEAELEAARDEALAASSAKTAFLANMSHEIRTPLNGVLGMTALLARSDLTPQQREWAELAHRSGEGLLSVVNDILDLTKIEAGRLDVSHRVFDLRRLVADAVAPLSAAAAAKQLDLRVDVAADLPRTVSGDPDRLRQVLINLLGNAVKFTPSGSVVLSAEPGPGSAVWFAVSDTGPGIHEDDQDRLFEPFAQADGSTTRRYGGTGLGLTISRDLVRVLGGELLVSSSAGAGSTFSFSLPMVELASSSPEPEAAPVPRPRAATGLRRVLLAEDSPVNQMVAVALLAAEGFEVDVVDDGQQALDRLEQDGGYEALLLDCQMPVLDGYDTARVLRAREAARKAPRLPVLALTAAAFTEDRERCLAAGMDDYLSKPFVPQDVVAALDRLTAEQ